MSESSTLNKIVEFAQRERDIAVMWLYGSRAKGTANEQSDYDLAIAFNPVINKQEFKCDDLAYHWSVATNESISIIDINLAPVPLAYAVISQGQVIFNRDALRLHSEEQRIWSLWSEYKYEHERNRRVI